MAGAAVGLAAIHGSWDLAPIMVANGRASDVARSFDHGMRLQKLLVDIHADAGLVERPHAAILADLPGFAAQLVAELVGDRKIGLEVAAIVDRGQEMDR